MTARAAAAAAALLLALLAGCGAAPQGGAPVASAAAPGDGAAQAQAASALSAQRAGLRRIGYRNCDGYAIELFAPARITAASASQQALFLRAYAYRAGGAIRLDLPGAAPRLQQQTGSGWQDLPRPAALGGGAVTGGSSGAVASASLPRQLGVTDPLNPGHYRAWLGRFSASRAGGAACAMTPVWQFDIT